LVKQEKPSSTVPSYFGNFPFPPDRKKPALVRRENMQVFMYPQDTPSFGDINRLCASTDKITVAIYSLAPGSKFEPPDVHSGDEVYYVIKGTLTQFNPETGDVHEVHEGEALYIPKGAWHQSYNFTDKEARMLAVLAPRAWDADNPPPSEFPGTPKLFKTSR
jgi:mannose-6-phosphate isomerase-like protein (cupin superfamily)